MDWKEYYTKLPGYFKETEFLQQVGKTVDGEAITEQQKQLQLDSIQKVLNIQKDDDILDLCCGNGVLTKYFASKCRSITGVDFSETLISIAQKYNSPSNAKYFMMSALDPKIIEICEKPFSKIFMYEALQYFNSSEFAQLLDYILHIIDQNSVIFIAGIPDISKIWNYYNTPERKADYYSRKKKGTEAIGNWWDKKNLLKICSKKGFHSEIISQEKLLISSHYRFDICLTPVKYGQ